MKNKAKEVKIKKEKEVSKVMKAAIRKVVEGEDLSMSEAKRIMNQIMDGEATDAQIASLLTALRLKGETVEEIAGFATVMREKAIRVKPKSVSLIDTCGTGGDDAGTFNVSTTVAFVVAGAGVAVAKHGNRSVSSNCGSADALEALGVRLDQSPERIAEAIDEVGIGFLFAPSLHTAMKHVMPVRNETGIRTVFNILGPLTNPARASAQVVGVYSGELIEILAEVLGKIGIKRALVVHGASGLDEISNTGPSQMAELKDGQISVYSIKPEDFGMRRVRLYELKGGSVQENARIIQDVLKGQTGPRRDIVLLNAAAAFVVADRVRDWQEGIDLAIDSLDSGSANEKLRNLVKFMKKKPSMARSGSK